MKKYFSLFALLPMLCSAVTSCTNSHEDDVVIFVPRQVRETPTEGENPKDAVLLWLSYDSQGRIKGETDGLKKTRIVYSIDSRIDSVSFVPTDAAKQQEKAEQIKNGIAEADVVLTDSIKNSYTYNGNTIEIKEYIYRSKKERNDSTQQTITLNAEQLAVSRTFGDKEERYTYTDSTLTSVEIYKNSVLQEKFTYEYALDLKSPYSEVTSYPAWYFTVYRYLSPKKLATKVTREENGASAVVYELTGFTTSDLDFVTKCTKTYYESSGTRAVIYRQDYSRLVIE